jgi:hypothetical protein
LCGPRERSAGGRYHSNKREIGACLAAEAELHARLVEHADADQVADGRE